MNMILLVSLLVLAATNYDESKVGSYTLPDPLVFNNGQRVRTAGDWSSRRRAEILRLFEASVYGHGPQAGGALNYEVLETDGHALGGKAIRKQVTIWLSPDKDGPKEDVLIYLPAGATKPSPLILSLNFGGNQTVINDPGIRLPMVWNPHTHVRQQALEETRGSSTDFQVEETLARGYGFATIYYQDIEPDFKGGMVHGIRPLFPEYDWGAIGAWAYGLSRAMDYLEKDSGVDAKRVAVMGHSRLGKTALWAGALDQRFAMVLSNCSGEGGASLSRRDYGETIRNLVDVFPYWFTAHYQKYADHADQLPVDAHELIALIAPRPVYITGAEDDQWADPRGEFLACVAAGPVYRLLGAQDLGTDQMPPLNHPIQHTIAFHYRTGKHEVTAFDWEQFLNFADAHLR
jgi:hypothetical protein